MSRINFLNIPIDAITMKQTLNSIDNAITLNKQIVQYVVFQYNIDQSNAAPPVSLKWVFGS